MKKLLIIFLLSLVFSPPASAVNTETIDSNITRLKSYLVNLFGDSPNNYTTRDEAQEYVTQYFHDLLGRRFLVAYVVICDDDNNTPEDIKNNRLIIDVYYQEHAEDYNQEPKTVHLVVENKTSS